MIIVPVIVGGILLVTKFAIFSAKHGVKWEYFFSHGHMPSFHTGFVISTSGVFALATIFSIIIIDDALRLRAYLGDQGRYLNRLIEQLPIDKNKFPRLKERIGHRSNEVIVGGLLGFVLTLALIRVLESL